jgi:hypothetical protein
MSIYSISISLTLSARAKSLISSTSIGSDFSDFSCLTSFFSSLTIVLATEYFFFNSSTSSASGFSALRIDPALILASSSEQVLRRSSSSFTDSSSDSRASLAARRSLRSLFAVVYSDSTFYSSVKAFFFARSSLSIFLFFVLSF